jgi:hypothetical protein
MSDIEVVSLYFGTNQVRRTCPLLLYRYLGKESKFEKIKNLSCGLYYAYMARCNSNGDEISIEDFMKWTVKVSRGSVNYIDWISFGETSWSFERSFKGMVYNGITTDRILEVDPGAENVIAMCLKDYPEIYVKHKDELDKLWEVFAKANGSSFDYSEFIKHFEQDYIVSFSMPNNW